MAGERGGKQEKKNEGLGDEPWWHWWWVERGAEELVGRQLNLLGQGEQMEAQWTGERGGQVEVEMKKLESTGTGGEEGCWAA